MKNFVNIFKGELLKGFKSKSVLITVLVLSIISLFFSLIFGMTVTQFNEMFPPEDTQDVSPQDVLVVIRQDMADTEEQYQRGEITRIKYKQTIYQLKSQELMFQYMLDNNLNFDDFSVILGDDMVRFATRQNLITYIMSMCFLVIGIIASILAAGTISDEISSGTMRLLLITPATRIKLLFSKMSAIIVQLMFYILVMLITASIMGLLLYPSVTKEVMIIFNADVVVMVPFLLSVIILGLLVLLYGFAIAVTVLTISLVLRNKVFAIIIGAVTSMNVISLFSDRMPSLFKLLKYTILCNMNFGGFFNGGGNYPGMLDLPIALIVYIINIVILFGLSCLLFKVRDIN